MAPVVGADVPFFLDGGSVWMEGYGERLTDVEPLAGFAVAVAVPPMEIPTAAAYRRWDELDGPRGVDVDGAAIPPVLRRHGPLRNDLTPAAMSLEPELADWAHEVSRLWGRPVLMTGSGSAHFAFFVDVDEATDAADEASGSGLSFAAGLRRTGVAAR